MTNLCLENKPSANKIMTKKQRRKLEGLARAFAEAAKRYRRAKKSDHDYYAGMMVSSSAAAYLIKEFLEGK